MPWDLAPFQASLSTTFFLPSFFHTGHLFVPWTQHDSPSPSFCIYCFLCLQCSLPELPMTQPIPLFTLYPQTAPPLNILSKTVIIPTWLLLSTLIYFLHSTDHYLKSIMYLFVYLFINLFTCYYYNFYSYPVHNSIPNV